VRADKVNSRERLLAALRGQKTDRIPWAPFLTYWWDQNLIAGAEYLGEIGFKRAVGADLLMRGHRDRLAHNHYEDLYMYRIEYEKTKITETADRKRKQVVYETPAGSITAGYSYSPGGDTWFLTEHPVKTPDDFKILAYIAADIRLTANHEDYKDGLKKNPDTLYLPLISPFAKTAFQSMIEFWVGTEELSYFEADYPGAVADTLAVMRLHGYRDPIKPQFGTTGGATCVSGADNEVWSFTGEVYEICKKYLLLREKLRDYISVQMKRASEKGTPVMRPLFYDFPKDPEAWEIEDEYMFGPNYLVAPVMYEAMRERKVYLPEGDTWTNAWDGEIFEGGKSITVSAPLDTIPVFTRDGSRLQENSGTPGVYD
jgi:hypothetical protein